EPSLRPMRPPPSLWGLIVRREAIPPELMTRARWAVANCPALALKLRKQKASRRGPEEARSTGRLQAPHPPAAALGPQRGTSWPKGVGDRYSRSVAVSRRTVSGPTGKRSGVLELTTRPDAPAALMEARNSVAAPPSKISLPMVVSQG